MRDSDTPTDADPAPHRLDVIFSALADPVRRAILERLEATQDGLLVSELAAPFPISLQAVSRHIHVLVRAGLVRQERTGRISRCRLDAAPMALAAAWLARCSGSRQNGNASAAQARQSAARPALLVSDQD
jgi:DNA-binding transcriptional ArsR family regulator